MPSQIDHIHLANRNHNTLNYLLQDPENYSEWIATVSFYKAVQLVEAMFSASKLSCNDHRQRHDKLKTMYPRIWKHYRFLWSASCIARYLHDNTEGNKYTSFSDYIKAEDVEKRVVKKRLKPIEEMVVGTLTEDSKNVLIRIPE